MICVNGYEVIDRRFPDHTLLLKELPLPKAGQGIKIYWLYENDAELFTLICARRHYADLPAVLEMPYVAHARMDRVKSGQEAFTLKYFCEVINSLNFDKVYVFDVHSNVTLALLNNVIEAKPYKHIEQAAQSLKSDNLMIFYPDEGAMKRYSDALKTPYAFGIKKRDWETGVIQGLDVVNAEAVEGKDILIVDDICSRGSTFLHSARKLKDLGAKNIYLYVSHLEETVLDGELYKEMKDNQLIECIFTANPLFDIPVDEERIIKIV